MFSKLFVYTITLIVFFGNFFEGYGLLPPFVNWLTEPLIYFFFLFSLASKRGSVKFPFIIWFLLLFIVGVCSAVLNHSLGLNTVFGMRLVFRYYLFFLALVNAGFSEEELRKIEKLILFCFFVQIPVIFVKMMIYGQGEQATGTYSMSDGSVVAFMPLIACGYLMGFYLYVRPAVKYLFYSIVFLASGIMGRKRALPFLTPPTFLFIGWLAMKDKIIIKRKIPNIKFRLIALVAILVFLTFVVSIKTMYSLNPEHKRGGSINFGFIAEKILSYEQTTSGENPEWTGGRTATTVRIFTRLPQKGIGKMMFGYSPGSYISSRFTRGRQKTGSDIKRNQLFKDMKFYYGVTPLNFTAMEYGFFGVIISILFLISMCRTTFKTWKLSQEPYQKAMAFGAVNFSFVYIVIWSWYSKSILLGDTMPYVFYMMLGLICVRYYACMEKDSTS